MELSIIENHNSERENILCKSSERLGKRRMSLPPISEASERKNSLSKIYDSKSSLNMKKTQLSKASKPIFTEGADEFIRLTTIIDSQKALMDRYSQDLKTLKIVNYRQEKALKKLDKDKSLAPKLIHTLTEELKIVKIEKAKYFSLSTKNEKTLQKQSNTITSLKKQIKDLDAVIQSKEGQDVLKLRHENESLNKKLQDLTNELELLQKKQKLLESEKDRDSKNLKSIINKQGQQIESLTLQISKLHEKIDEKEKQINSLNIYSTHAAERKQLRSRTAQERGQTATDQASKIATQGNPLVSDSHPLTDALINSIMNKSATAPRDTNDQSTLISPQSLIHKPNLSYDKKPIGGSHETVEDILARRMRDHISVNGPPKQSD